MLETILLAVIGLMLLAYYSIYLRKEGGRPLAARVVVTAVLWGFVTVAFSDDTLLHQSAAAVVLILVVNVMLNSAFAHIRSDDEALFQKRICSMREEFDSNISAEAARLVKERDEAKFRLALGERVGNELERMVESKVRDRIRDISREQLLASFRDEQGSLPLGSAIWVELEGANGVFNAAIIDDKKTLAVPYWVIPSDDPKGKVSIWHRNTKEAFIVPRSMVSFRSCRWNRVEGQPAIVVGGVLISKIVDLPDDFDQ